MVTCTECGEHNPVGTEFCLYCHAFLAWDEAQPAQPAQPVPRAAAESPPPADARTTSRPTGPVGRPLNEAAAETRMMPKIQLSDDGTPVRPGPTSAPAPDPAEPVASTSPDHDLFRLRAEQTSITVPPSGEPATLVLPITNTSGIVDGYSVETPGAPPWLVSESAQISLLPGAEDSLAVRMRIVSPTLVPAQQVRVLVRVRSLSQSPGHTDVPVTVTVPVVDAPVRLRAEPRLLRIRDADVADFTVLVDNSSSNRTARLTFSGTDPELAVQFRFDPPVLEVPPGGSGAIKVSVRAAKPEAGQEMSRALTVAAVEGPRSVETQVNLQQATSVEVVDPMVTLEVVPSVVRVRDRNQVEARVVVDNTGGRDWAHVRMEASDPERSVRVTWEQPLLHVPPGRTAQTGVRFEAQLPEAGSEVSRQITVVAGDGRRRASTTATLIQAASESAMTTLAIRLEPSVLRVQDADGANGQVLVDNRRGAAGVRVFLQGQDPENAMRFSFQEPVVELGPGQTRTVAMRLDAWRPPPGEQVTRQFTISAGDGQTAVETSGSLNQVSSRNPIELLQLKLDPSALHLSGGRRGQLTAVLDNRAGTQPVRVSLRGDDPMNVVGFTFSPAVLDVPPRAVTTALVAVQVPRPAAGQEVTRPFTVVATDGRAETAPAEGSIAQSLPARVSHARQIWRVLLTLFGGLAVIAGVFLPFGLGDDLEAAKDFDGDEVSQVFTGQGLPFESPIALSVGLLLGILAVIMMFGLTGPKGMLTRLMALLIAAIAVGLPIAFFVLRTTFSLDVGLFVILFGCVLGYVGGLLVKR